MNNDEVLRVQTYLRLKFSNDMLTLMNLSAHCSATMKTAKYLMLSTWPFWNLTCQPSDWDAA